MCLQPKAANSHMNNIMLSLAGIQYIDQFYFNRSLKLCMNAHQGTERTFWVVSCVVVMMVCADSNAMHVFDCRMPLSDDVTRPPPPGFIASLDKLVTTPMEYSYTDATWRCSRRSPDIEDTSTPHLSWYERDFDDWNWPQAEVLGRNGEEPYEPMEAITGNAQWIWPGGRSQDELEEDERDYSVYCRGWLSEQPGQLLAQWLFL